MIYRTTLGSRSILLRTPQADFRPVGDTKADLKSDGETDGAAIGQYYGSATLGKAVGGAIGSWVGGLFGGSSPPDCTWWYANAPDIPLTDAEINAMPGQTLGKPPVKGSIANTVDQTIEKWAQLDYYPVSLKEQQNMDLCVPTIGGAREAMRARLWRTTLVKIGRGAVIQKGSVDPNVWTGAPTSPIPIGSGGKPGNPSSSGSSFGMVALGAGALAAAGYAAWKAGLFGSR